MRFIADNHLEEVSESLGRDDGISRERALELLACAKELKAAQTLFVRLEQYLRGDTDQGSLIQEWRKFEKARKRIEVYLP